MIKLILILISVVLYPSSWAICEYFHPGNTNKDAWDNVRHILYISWAFIGYFCITLKPSPKFDIYSKALIYVLLYSMAAPAILEKILVELKWLDKDSFTVWDVIGVSLGVYGSFKELLPKLIEYVGSRSRNIK